MPTGQLIPIKNYGKIAKKLNLSIRRVCLSPSPTNVRQIPQHHFADKGKISLSVGVACRRHRLLPVTSRIIQCYKISVRNYYRTPISFLKTY